MLSSIAMLADALPTAAESLPSSGGLFQKNTGAKEVMLIVGVGLTLALFLFLLVYITREKRARQKGLVRSSRVLYRESRGSSGRGKVRKKRRSHPDNLPRNPTLGETGGLPPLRPEEPSEPVA